VATESGAAHAPVPDFASLIQNADEIAALDADLATRESGDETRPGMKATLRYKKRGAASVEFRPVGIAACAAAAAIHVVLSGRPGDAAEGRQLHSELPGDTARLRLARFCKSRGWQAEYVVAPRVAVLVSRPSGFLTAHYAAKDSGRKFRSAKEACAAQALVDLDLVGALDTSSPTAVVAGEAAHPSPADAAAADVAATAAEVPSSGAGTGHGPAEASKSPSVG